MSRWLVEKAACETWVTESSSSSLHSVTVTSLISTPEQIQICFMPIMFLLSCCSTVTSREWLVLPEPVPQLWAVHWGTPVPAVTCPGRGTEPLPELWAGCVLLGSAERFGHGLCFPGSFPEQSPAWIQVENRTGDDPTWQRHTWCAVLNVVLVFFSGF